MKAAYTASGAGAEIGKTLPLEPGEVVITEGMVRLYANPVWQRPCYLRLTSPRLCVLEHFALRPDRLTEVPPAAVESLSRSGDRVLITWTSSSGDVRAVTLVPWSGRIPAIRRLPDRSEELAATLSSWREVPM
jgi:hypothetical protein